MSNEKIRSLFANDIDRRIEEVIKVDQTDDAILREEIREYVVTNALQKHFKEILDLYEETPKKPHEGIAVWVSGFFGSGKSSFAKMLGMSISNKQIDGDTAADLFSQRVNDRAVQVLLKTVAEKIPTHAVIFDVSTDRGIRSGNQTLTEIMYGLFLNSLGYAKDLDLSELEISLEEENRLAAFEDEYKRLFNNDWNTQKGLIAFSMSQASRVMNSLYPDTYPTADSWVNAVRGKADITPSKLAERANELMKRRRPGQSLMFVIDEVGQFVARDVQKMLDLQAVVQSLGVKGRGRHWVVITSQERLNELVSGLDDKRVELARLTDRFSMQVHLESTDISEVTSRRVLTKSASAQSNLGCMYDDFRGRLTEHARLTADIKLTELNRESFIELYPLLPYQVDLIIQVVSGLRTQSGGSRHMGGANRTVIKLAQQLLINPATNLADQPIGDLARLDQIYDLVEGNIASELRAKIDEIPKRGIHPLAQKVAKALCLLQFVKSVHRTPENIAASLHPSVGADSYLPAVREAIKALETAHLVRSGDDGYRIQTPAEDDWERRRMSHVPRPGDTHRIHAEILEGFWQPQPNYSLLGIKSFKAGLSINGRNIAAGDISFQMYLTEEDKLASVTEDLRKRSQQELKEVFWAVPLNEGIHHETVELFRSKSILEEKEREARTATETGLVAEEKHRQRKHQEELRRLLKTACLSGNIYFRGNDRSAGDRTVEVGKCASEVMATALPDVFNRFKEAAAKATDVKNGTDALFTAENLKGLPPVFSNLSLLRDEKNQVVFKIDTLPLSEVMSRIEERARYGEKPSGRFITEELAKEPFGWDFDVVRLFILCLLRAGCIEVTSKGQPINTASSVEAREAFSNNNLFRQASFQPRKGPDAVEMLKASDAFRSTFGREVRELTVSSIVSELREEIERHEDAVTQALGLLKENQLPGTGVLDAGLGEMKAILRGNEDSAITTFNASHRTINEAILRAAHLEHALNATRLQDLARARQVLDSLVPFLLQEEDLSHDLRKLASDLDDLLKRELFFNELGQIEQNARHLKTEYERRHDAARKDCVEAYSQALEKLFHSEGWDEIDETQQERIAAPLRRGIALGDGMTPIPQLRSELAACESRLKAAIAELLRLITGERLAPVDIGSFFGSGIETMEQLEEALKGIHEECARLIGAGKRVIPQ